MYPILSKFLTICLNLLLWIFILIVYSIPLALGISIRLIINRIARKLHPEFIPCSPNDVLLGRETPDRQPIANGGIVLRSSGRLDYLKFQGLFQELFLTPDNFNRYLNFYCDLVKFCGFLFKRIVERKIKVEEHFIEKELKDGESFKEELANWFQTQYKQGLPLWQVIFLYCPKLDESYLAIKGHHVLVDGYSLVHVLDKLTGNSAHLTKEDEENSFWHEVKLFLGLPKVAFGYLLRNFWYPDNFPRVPLLTKVEMMPMGVGTSDLEPIKILRRKLNVHFPCIIYSLQVGTIRRFLLETMKEEDLTKVTFLSTSFPVPMHPRNMLINHWSGGTVKIPLREESAKNRVLATNQSFEEITGDDGPYLIWKYVAYINWLFPAFLSYPMSFVNLSLYRYRCSISCMPQSPIQYYLMGSPVLNIYHAPIMKDSFPQAIMLGCSSSHKDQIDFSLFGHPDLFPDQKSMDRLLNIHFKAELEQLMKECDLEDLPLNWREQ